MNIHMFGGQLQGYENALTYAEMSENTIRKYIQAVQNFLHYASMMNLKGEVSKDGIIAYKEYLTNKYKANTVNLYLTAVNKYLNYLDASDLRVKSLRIQRKYSVDNCMSHDEYKKMLEVAKRFKNNSIYYIMRSLAGTGVRISTLEYFTVEAVNEGSCVINNKGKIRNIVIPDSVCKELEQYCSMNDISSGYIFHGKNPDKVINVVTVRRWLKKVANLAGIDPAKAFPHNLRHLFAKRFMDVHNDLPELADILGHTRIETTRIYTRTSTAEKRIKMENLNL